MITGIVIGIISATIVNYFLFKHFDKKIKNITDKTIWEK